MPHHLSSLIKEAGAVSRPHLVWNAMGQGDFRNLIAHLGDFGGAPILEARSKAMRRRFAVEAGMRSTLVNVMSDRGKPGLVLGKTKSLLG
jgi:hypothetical protein